MVKPPFSMVKLQIVETPAVFFPNLIRPPPPAPHAVPRGVGVAQGILMVL